MSWVQPFQNIDNCDVHAPMLDLPPLLPGSIAIMSVWFCDTGLYLDNVGDNSVNETVALSYSVALPSRCCIPFPFLRARRVGLHPC